MSDFVNIIGKKFGKLLVLEETKERKNGSKIYKCKCDCGNTTYVRRCNLISKNGTKSCGCSHVGHTKQGKRHTRIYSIWLNMKQRCYNPKSTQYKDWGGRGVIMCDDWKNDFMTFYDWAMSNGYKKGLTIDRIDVNGNYEPNNCRWVTPKEQANNRRNTPYITYQGKKQSLKQWSEELNVNYYTMRKRYKKGWKTKEILFGKIK